MKVQVFTGETDVIFVAHRANCGNYRKLLEKPLKMAT